MAKLLLSFVILTSVIPARFGGETASHPPILCNGHNLTKVDLLHKGETECYIKYVPKGVSNQTEIAVHLQNNTCFSVCLQKGNGLLKENGEYDATSLSKLVDQVYPTPTLRKEVVDAMKGCADASGLSKPLSMSNNCIQYLPFSNCILEKWREICKF